MNELLKQGDFVIVYDTTSGNLIRGIIIQDEQEGSQVFVCLIRWSQVQQNYYDRKNVIKI